MCEIGESDTTAKPSEPSAIRSAYNQCSEMEGALGQITNLASVLAVIAEAQGRSTLGSALHGVANALDDRYEELYKRWERLLHDLFVAEKGDAP